MLQDFRYVLRSLTRSPVLSIVLMITLAVGLAGSSASFSILDAALIRTLPVDNPQEMVSVFEIDLETGERLDSSPANFADWRRSSNSFAAMALLSMREYTVSRRGAFPERLAGMLVSEDFFAAFGRPALKGRVLLPEDFRSGTPAVVVTHAFWKTWLGGAARALEDTLTLDGESYQIVGVMPDDFNFTRLPDSEKRASFWLPRNLDREIRTYRRSARLFPAIARLAPGVSISRAEEELQAVGNALAEQFPDGNQGHRIQLAPLREVMAAGSRKALLVLFGAFAFFWLVCIVNVANLMLGRSIAREGEMAVRTALGASRRALCRLTLVEVATICALSVLVAALLAPWALQAMSLFNFGAWPEVAHARFDGRSLLFLVSLATVSSLLGALVTLPRVWTGAEPQTALQDRSLSQTRDRRLLATGLVVAEVALATVLSVGAGLMLSTFFQLNRVDVGFVPENVFSFRLSIPPREYRDAGLLALLRRELERLENLPGVVAAAVGPSPLGGAAGISVVAESQAEPVVVKIGGVSPDYFRVLGIPLRQGRVLGENDREGSELVAVVSEALAQKLWPGENPIGRILHLSDESDRPRRVVGVVGNVRRAGPEDLPSSDLYLPQPQLRQIVARSFLLKTDGRGARDLPEAVRRSVAQGGAQLALSGPTWLDAALADTWQEKRSLGLLLICLAALSLGLAIIGLYGVVTAYVNLRKPEIGVRIALGAAPSRIFQWVISKGGAMLLLGLSAGLLLALSLSPLLERFLFQVSPVDPTALAAVALSVSASALLACAIPARRAARVDPMQVLRSL